MPQQRRKVPFSGKKKKDQIAQKRLTKVPPKYIRPPQESYEDSDVPEVSARKLMEQPYRNGRNKNVNRYNLQFYQESKKEMEQIRQEGFKPLRIVTPEEREIDDSFFAEFLFPVRPEWNHEMNKDALERSEQRYFREFVDQMQRYQCSMHKEFSLFELNLETWRQLWRVLEMSDILLIIVDVRYATLMFPPALYDYIINKLKKHAILVFNKVDLVVPEVVVAWRNYFNEQYPNLPVVLFASYPAKVFKGTQRSRQAHKRSMEGVHSIYRVCEKIVQNKVDLGTWEQKILEDKRIENNTIEEETTEDEAATGEANTAGGVNMQTASSAADTQPEALAKYFNGILTIGCVGFPNVGKSSLINALKGRKVVSVSRTPGHTKHFQTIFLTNVVRLCDCPGLVFPSSTPKHLQVLLGSYPISQLQVPYRSLKFLSEHVNLVKLLKLNLPEDFAEWSAIAIADAWALKRGFLTAKAARPDRYRAANHILRMCLAGQQQIVLQFYPPGFESVKEKWQNHAEVAEVAKYQNAEEQHDDHDCTDDTSSVCSDTADSDAEDATSSNDETNADDDELAASSSRTPPKLRNTYALLADE